MTDSVTCNLLDREGRIISLCDLPAEMIQTILSYCGLLPLMRMSTTCSALRYNVHEVFTSRIYDQAAKYPEVKRSLDRLGWRKKHNFWDCKCFEMMGGPVFSWSQLEEQRNFSVVCKSDLCRTSATTADKSFFMTSGGEICYRQVGPGSNGGRNSLRTLVTLGVFENVTIPIYNIVTLASYDNVLAIIFKTRGPEPSQRTVLVYVFNTSTLVKVAELNLGNDEDGPVFIKAITLTQNTMVIGLDYHHEEEDEVETKIHIWKMDSKDPQEEGITLLRTISHHNSQLSKQISNLGWVGETPFCVNNRFIVIYDYNDDSLVKVFQRSEENPLVCEIDIGDETVVGMAMQEGQGDHIAFLLRYLTPDRVPKHTVKVYSASRGELIIQKEGFDPVSPYWWIYSPFLIKWFGDHLIIGNQEDHELSFFTWQPGQPAFLNSPFRVPVVRRSTRGNAEGNIKWITCCLKLDFQGLVTATNKQYAYFEEMVHFKTWKS